MSGRLVRSFDNGDTSEGIVADDELKQLYVAEEDVAVWNYGAEPTAGSTRTAVDRVTAAGGNLTPNIKNPTIYYGRNGTGYLIVSSQGGSNFLVYNRGDHAFLGSFKIGSGAGVDGVSGQDSIDVTNFALGSAFPGGLFTSQDHVNSDSGNGNSGNQNYKYVSWQRIADSFSPKLLVDTTYDPRQVGAGGTDPGPDPGDSTPPETTIESGPSGTVASGSASFTFSANESSTFQCSLDSGAFSACVSPQAYADLAAGSHTFSVRATDTAGNVDATPATRSWVVETGSSSISTFTAVADASVQASAPDTNLGGATTLSADSSPQEESYLRFDVQGLSGSVGSAKLRLWVTNGSTNGPAVYPTATGWDEGSVTWNTGRPARSGPAADDKAAVASGTWMEFDVTSLVTGNGSVSFNVASTSSDGTVMSSREAAANKPQLVVSSSGTDPGPDPGDSTPPSVTAVAPGAGAAGVAMGADVDAVFSEAMDATSVTGETFQLRQDGAADPVVSSVSYDATSRTATLNPANDLQAGTTYTATVTAGVKDAAGNAMSAPREWSFTTASGQEPPPAGTVSRMGTSTVVNSTATGSVTVPKPAGAAQGDVLVACIATNGGRVAAGGEPAGWNSIAAVTSVSNPHVFGYYRVVGPSDPADYTWQLSGTLANSGGIARYTGVSGSSPLDGTPSAASGAAATSGSIPGVAPSVSGGMLAGCMSLNTSVTSVTVAPPTGMTAAWDLGGKRQQYADEALSATGPTGSRTWTFGASRAWAGWLVALRPGG